MVRYSTFHGMIIYEYTYTHIGRGTLDEMLFLFVLPEYFTLRVLCFITWAKPTKPWKTKFLSQIIYMNIRIDHKCYFFYILHIYIIGSQ